MPNFELDDIKLIIQSLCISSKEPISVRDLIKDFKESEGEYLPFASFGYSNIHDFLSSLDVIKVLPNGTLVPSKSSETEHLVQLIKKQKSNKRNKPRRRSQFSKTTNYSQTQYNRQRSTRPRNQAGAFSRPRNSGSKTNYWDNKQGISNFCRNQSNGYDGRQRTPNYPSEDPDNRNNAAKRNHMDYHRDHEQRKNMGPDPYAFGSSNSSSSEEGFEIVEPTEVLSQITPLVHEPQVTITRVDLSNELPAQLKSNLREIVREHPEGILCSQLSQLVREKYGVPLNFRKYGFSSMVELVDSIPEIFRINQANHDWVLLDAQNPSANRSKASSIPSKVCDRVLELSKTLNYPTSPQLFNKLYENMFHVSLLDEVEGFPSIISILTSIDGKNIRLKEVDGDYFVVPLVRRVANALEALEAVSDDGLDTVDYPKFMLPLGGEIPALNAFSDAVGPTVDVQLAEVYGPHKFFMMPVYMKEAYDNLQENIQQFYDRSDHLALTGLPVKKGLYCAAFYLDKWHRAVITATCEEDQVIVHLIDFGTRLKQPKTKTRFLHEDFSTIPKLAMRSSIQDIIPPKKEDKFSREANLFFCRLTVDKILRAHIRSVDMKEKYYVVQLKEMDGSSIDHKLITAGVAEKFKKSTGSILLSLLGSQSKKTV